jgi:hypothetical protein
MPTTDSAWQWEPDSTGSQCWYPATRNEFTATVEQDGALICRMLRRGARPNGQGRSRPECIANLREAIIESGAEARTIAALRAPDAQPNSCSSDETRGLHWTCAAHPSPREVERIQYVLLKYDRDPELEHGSTDLLHPGLAGSSEDISHSLLHRLLEGGWATHGKSTSEQ